MPLAEPASHLGPLVADGAVEVFREFRRRLGSLAGGPWPATSSTAPRRGAGSTTGTSPARPARPGGCTGPFSATVRIVRLVHGRDSAFWTGAFTGLDRKPFRRRRK